MTPTPGIEATNPPSLSLHARLVDRAMAILLAITAAIPLGSILAITFVLFYQSWQFFQIVPLGKFLTESRWTPLFTTQSFGIIVLLSATLLVSGIALTLAIPLGLLSAIYLKEYASPWQRRWLKPLLETLSSVPTVVFGYFAIGFITPQLQTLFPGTSIFNSLSAGIMTGVLITPIVASLSEDALWAVPEVQRQGAYSCGFTRQEVVFALLVPAALPGILASFTLAASRALGETMIAAIAAGQSPILTLNPLQPNGTLTAFIVQVSLGDVPPDSLIFKTIFAVGTTLFLITLSLNSCGQWLIHRYHQLMEGQNRPQWSATSPAELIPETIADLGIGTFRDRWGERRWGDRALHGLGLLSTLLGPTFFGLLIFVTCRNGIPYLNWQLLTSFTSRDPAAAGVLPALAGTLWLLALTALISLPLGIAAALYLEEYDPKGWWTRIIEVTILNATAIPGILYGLLGLALFAKELQGITGGRTLISGALVMSLLVIPLVITTTRTALQAVPNHLRRSGYALGLSRWQVTWNLTLPAALPDIVTGIGLALSRVLGETSPLLALGTVEFITFMPTPTWDGLRVPFLTLTTQIFFWLSRPQVGFQNRAAAAILLLGLLGLGLNLGTGWLRDRLRDRLSAR